MEAFSLHDLYHHDWILWYLFTIESKSTDVHWYQSMLILTPVYIPLPEEAPPGLPPCSPQVRIVNPSKPKVTVGHNRANVHGFYVVHLWPLSLWGQLDHTPPCSRWAGGWKLVAFTGGRLRQAGLMVFQHLSMTTWANDGRRKEKWAPVEPFLPVLRCWCVDVASDGNRQPAREAFVPAGGKVAYSILK